jgi:ferric-dicitrate binding protein FerR (iron transport regulator)
MRTDLHAGLRDLIDGGAAPVTPIEVAGRAAGSPSPDPRRTRPRRVALIAVAAAAIVCAGAVTATELTGATKGTAASHQAVLTAAMVRHVPARRGSPWPTPAAR